MPRRKLELRVRRSGLNEANDHRRRKQQCRRRETERHRMRQMADLTLLVRRRIPMPVRRARESEAHHESNGQYRNHSL